MQKILRSGLSGNKHTLATGLVCVLAFGLCRCFAEDNSPSLMDVLKKESHGLDVDRVSQLKSLTENEKDLSAKWHSGYVFVDGAWMATGDLSEAQLSSAMESYIKLRGTEKLSGDAHRRLAKWCMSNGLSEQYRAHWHGVLEANQDDAEARKALGFERIGSTWFSKEDIARASKTGNMRLHDLKTWMPKMQQFAIAISSSDTRKKSKAIEEIKGIDDTSAIQALYITAVQLRGDYARPFVEVIKKHRSAEACLALVKIAVASPESVAAEIAIDGVKEYRLEFFVPELLALIEDDVEMRQDLVVKPNGELVLEQVMLREKSDLKSMQVINKMITLDSSRLPVGASRASTPRSIGMFGGLTIQSARLLVSSPENESAKSIAKRDAERQAEKAEDEVRQHNAKAKELRQNVVRVLNATTGANPGTSAQEWWNWWEGECEDNRISSKPYVLGYAKDYGSLVYGRQVSNVESRSVLPLVSPPVRRCECLVAGTPVQTLSGLRAIESIKTGDMVLSNDIESGKIEFKPVLRTTVRPPVETMVITTNKEAIQTTLGHYWWVSGHGWLRTKEIAAGMRLHTATGTCLVESVEPVSEKAVTYNLIVADNHSYFVGVERVLSNDATELKPSLMKVPGLDPKISNFDRVVAQK